MSEKGKGLDLPERVRHSLAGAVAERGVQARVISTQGRESMRPPQGHVIVAATVATITGDISMRPISRELCTPSRK